MALIYFYDSTELDREQLSKDLQDTDHHWKFIEEKISIENLDPETEVISVFVSSTVTREMIEKLPRLRVIACRSTGFNNVDFEAANERDIAVLNVPTYGESTVAEYAFTILLALQRKLEKVLQTENTEFMQPELLGNDLNGKTIGVVGTGHIGQHSIKIAKGFEMNVIAYDPFPNEDLANELGFIYKSLDELLAESDIITLHAPYLPSTHHMIDNQSISKIKKGAVLINTARGELVDTHALLDGLKSGQIGGAGLDVVEGEVLLHHDEEEALLRSNTISEDFLRHSVEISLLKKMPNVIISPHNAFNTIEAVQRINSTTVKNIIDYWYGETPNRVQPPKKSRGKLLIARHAESEWNATGKWTGLTDVHLSEKGFAEAKKLGFALKNLEVMVDIAYCSEQIRSRETLEGMLNAAQMFEVDIVRDGAINERDYGDYTGKNKWEIKDEVGEEEFNAIRRGWDTHIPNGENLKMVYERSVPFYKETIVPLLESGKNVLVVAHGNSIRSLIKYIEDISDEDVGKLEMIFGEIIIYSTDENGKVANKESISIDTVPPDA